MRNREKAIYLIKGLILSFIISFTLIIILALLLQFTSLREDKLSVLNNINIVLSISIASGYIGVKLKEKGWINGLILGFLYSSIILLINIIEGRSIFINSIFVIRLLTASLIGAIGGMIGVNLKWLYFDLYVIYVIIY